jgi:hypothetical protein
MEGERYIAGMINVTKTNYDQFKFRHNLLTGKQFRARYNYGRQNWALPLNCFFAYEKAFRHLNNGGLGASFGQLSAHAAAEAKLGVLPIEVGLWAYIYATFLEVQGLDMTSSLTMLDTDLKSLARLWEEGIDGGAWSVEPFYREALGADPAEKLRGYLRRQGT